MNRRSILRTAGIAALAVALVAPQAGAVQEVGRVFEQAGPYQVAVVQRGSTHTLFYPADMATAARKHPVVVWGNGTGATVQQYDVFLRHLATWGFVVAAANTGQAGSGAEMLDGARFLVAENSRAGSVFQGRIDTANIGAAGHSQGGGGAIAAGADPMVKATLPVMPGPQGSVPALRGPSLFIAGQFDYVVPSFYVRGRYAWAKEHPAVFAELKGSDHFFPGETRARMVGVGTAWLRYWLAGDAAGKRVFFGPEAGAELFQDPAWSDVERNAKAAAIA
ncbi:hypothetical protein GCM10023148_29890 [Actinokineospora soli]